MPDTRPSRRREQAAGTRRKLLDAGRALFARNGYAATSVRELHHAAGLTDGILYHYFPEGKQELFRTIVEEEFQNIVAQTNREEMEFPDEPLEEVLEGIYRTWMRLLDEHSDIFRIMFCEHEVRDILPTEEVARIISGRQQWLPQLLRQRTEAGEIGEIDYDAASGLVLSVMFDGIVVRVSNIGGGWLDDPRQRKTMFEALVASWKASR